MPQWSSHESEKLVNTIEEFTTTNKWRHPDKYHRQNVPVWRALKLCMDSSRDYRSIGQRYKSHHDPVLQANVNKILTQQEESVLLKYVI